MTKDEAQIVMDIANEGFLELVKKINKKEVCMTLITRIGLEDDDVGVAFATNDNMDAVMRAMIERETLNIKMTETPTPVKDAPAYDENGNEI
jgi:hypothetical protein